MNSKKSLATRPENREARPQVRAPRQPRYPRQVLVVRTDRRSWIMIAVTAFGALLLRYLKTVRERGLKSQMRRSKH